MSRVLVSTTIDVRGNFFVRARLVCLMVLVVVLASSRVQAQLFGDSRSFIRQDDGSSAESVEGGNLRGNERFLRQNRRRSDFVGADRFERRSFVGSQQGSTSGSALPSTLGVRPDVDRSFQINQPLTRPTKNQAYYPQLRLDDSSLDVTRRVNADSFQQGSQLKQELENPDYFSATNRISVSLLGRTAVLRGAVADDRQKKLAALLASFEPGVSAVVNELIVRHDSQQVEYDEPPRVPLPPASTKIRRPPLTR